MNSISSDVVRGTYGVETLSTLLREASSHEDSSECESGDARAMLVLPPLVLLVAAMLLAAMTAQAFGSTAVPLHGPHVGANSETFNNESDNGGLTDPVVWHFVLNQLDKGAPAGQPTATFASGGTKAVTGNPVGNGAVQHFYVGTNGHDVLLAASAVVSSSGGKLLLSHVSYSVVPPVDEDEKAIVTSASEEEEFLPFTGGTAALLAFAGALASAGGYGLRQWAIRR